MPAKDTVPVNHKALRAAFEARGLSQTELAKETGISVSAVGRILKGADTSLDNAKAMKKNRTLGLRSPETLTEMDSTTIGPAWKGQRYADADGQGHRLRLGHLQPGCVRERGTSAKSPTILPFSSTLTV